MSDLQLALLGLGAAVMISIIGYNKLQERRHVLRRRRGASGGALVAPPGALGEPTQPPEDLPPVDHRVGMQQADGTDSAIGASLQVLDHRVDYVATLSFVAAHLGEEVLRRSGEIVRASKPVEWEGFAEPSHTWEVIVPGKAYRQVRAGLQLLDRRGLATEADVVGFCHDLQGLAATLVAEIDFPPRAEALKSAGEFDRQLADLDIQVGLNVVRIGGPGISGSAIQEVAERAGARLQSDGRFWLTTEDGAEVFTLANLEPNPFGDRQGAGMTTRGVTVAMDVPRAPDSEEAFSRFVAFARELSHDLDAELVDDNRRPISEAALAAIKAEVVRVRTRLAQLGIQAGSPLALRTFS